MSTLGAGIVRLLNGLAIAANTAGALVVVALVAVLNYDVVARGVFGAPFLGAVEVVQFSVVLIVFLQLPDVVRVGRLTRSDGFLLVLGRNRPRWAALSRRITNGVSALLMLLIAIAMWPEFTEAWQGDDFFGIPGVFTAPWWPVKLTILLSAGLCTALFVVKTIRGDVASPFTDDEEAPV